MSAYYTFLTFLTAACIGSFINVLIYRIPRGLPFIKGSSCCTTCGEKIKARDLIPVISYIILKGKCGSCGTAISIKYPIVEVLSGVLGLLSIWKYGYNFTAMLCFFIFVTLLAISFIDACHMIIPFGLVVSLFVLSVFFTVSAWGMPESPTITSRLIGFFALSVPMLIITIIISNAFGGGDIKLIAVCGFLLGVRLVLLSGFIAIILGGIYGVFIKYIRKKDNAHIAFGQYICIGVIVSLLCGTSILHWYFSMFGL